MKFIKTKDLSNTVLTNRFHLLLIITVVLSAGALAQLHNILIFSILSILPIIFLDFLVRAGIEILVRIRAGEKDF